MKCQCYVIIGRGMPANASLDMNECCPSILLTLDRKGHQPVMSSIVVYIRAPIKRVTKSCSLVLAELNLE